MRESEVGWGFNVVTMMEDQWSFGICLSHWWDETYIYINFFKWTVSFGKISK